MESSFSKIVKAYSDIILESAAELDFKAIAKNFKATEEFKRLSEGLDEKQVKKLSKAVDEASEEMANAVKKLALPFNKKNLKFVQFTSPEKKGGYSAGYLVPRAVINKDTVSVVSVSPARKNGKDIKLGEYLTEDAYSKIKASI